MVTVLSKTGAQVIVDRLLCEGVSFAFGLCGHGNIGLLNALYDVQGQIHTVSVHHEQAAGHMADAYWRVAHRPAVTFTSCGPGSTNIPVAVASAMMDSSALLAITANIPSVQFNRGAFQETYRHYQADFPSVLRPYVKRSFQPTRPDQLPLVMRQAFLEMLGGRPGPVQVDVPLDLFAETVDVGGERPQAVGDSVRIRSAAEAGQLQAALETLLGAAHPVILAGGGTVLSEAEADVRTLAERLGVPVVSTPLASGVLPADHPLYFGNVGRNGTFAANEATRNADVILALGVRFDDRMSSSWIPGYTFEIPPTKLIQVDIDPSEIGRNYPVAVGVLGDARTVVRQLAAELERRRQPRAGHAEWVKRLEAARQVWENDRAPLTKTEGLPLHPERVVATLSRALPENALVLSDVGVHHNWLVQRLRVRGPRSFLQSWGFGSMCFAVCGVLGAKLAAPDRPAVAVCGDGGFLMAAHSVATAVEYDIPAIWVVWNNCGYASIYDLQVGAFGPRELATRFRKQRTGEPVSADFAALAQAMGADGYRVTRPGDLDGALAAALAANRPAVIDVPVRSDERPVPTGGWVLPPLRPFAPAYRPKPG
ncbi:MAG: thiamine pyrophosphate-binding protein [Bacillati bacterium ANGP1]|uniref:Thiamine pyrophosphate-binding protein n=1 Tax=Candidatus Segetimicrobium genomatis TaxID=2569760 RepID=A0A537JH84_9BACT|nr:MAG: thiamine pyrophosphate-binding protein [Terrabacteria group bacterium ANGP1]